MDFEKLIEFFKISSIEVMNFIIEIPSFYLRPIKAFKAFFQRQPTERFRQLVCYLIIAALLIMIFSDTTKEIATKILLWELLFSVALLLFVSIGDVLIVILFRKENKIMLIYQWLILVKIIYAPIILVLTFFYQKSESLDFLLAENIMLLLLYLVLWIAPAFIFYEKIIERVVWILMSNLLIAAYLLLLSFFLVKGFIDEGLDTKLDLSKKYYPIDYEINKSNDELLDSVFYPEAKIKLTVVKNTKPFDEFIILDSTSIKLIKFYLDTINSDYLSQDRFRSILGHLAKRSHLIVDSAKANLEKRNQLQTNLKFNTSKKINQLGINSLNLLLKEQTYKIDTGQKLSIIYPLSDSFSNSHLIYLKAANDYYEKRQIAEKPLIYLNYVFPLLLLSDELTE